MVELKKKIPQMFSLKEYPELCFFFLCPLIFWGHSFISGPLGRCIPTLVRAGEQLSL